MGRYCATESGRSSAIRGKSIPLTIRGQFFSVPGDPPLRAIPAAHAGAVSGGGVQPRQTVRRRPCRMRLRRSAVEGAAEEDRWRDIRRRAAEAGRDPHSILIFNLQTVIVGDTDREAQAKWQEYKQYVSYEGALALLSGWTGIDFGQYQPDQVLKYLHTNAIQSAVEAFRPLIRTASGRCRPWPIGRGSAASVRWWLATRANRGGRTAVLGRRRRTSMALTLAYAVTHETFRDVVELLVPELQKRGVFKQEYREGTLRENCSAPARVWPRPHPGASYRRDARTAASVEEKVT